MSSNRAILVLIQSVYFLVLKTPLISEETIKNEIYVKKKTGETAFHTYQD